MKHVSNKHYFKFLKENFGTRGW